MRRSLYCARTNPHSAGAGGRLAPRGHGSLDVDLSSAFVDPAGEPVWTFQRRQDRRSRLRRWTDAPQELRALQAEYEAWRKEFPESLADSRTAELLEGVSDVNRDALDLELPRGC